MSSEFRVVGWVLVLYGELTWIKVLRDWAKNIWPMWDTGEPEKVLFGRMLVRLASAE